MSLNELKSWRLEWSYQSSQLGAAGAGVATAELAHLLRLPLLDVAEEVAEDRGMEEEASRRPQMADVLGQLYDMLAQAADKGLGCRYRDLFVDFAAQGTQRRLDLVVVARPYLAVQHSLVKQQ
jgi:hypothetical protein